MSHMYFGDLHKDTFLTTGLRDMTPPPPCGTERRCYFQQTSLAWYYFQLNVFGSRFLTICAAMPTTHRIVQHISVLKRNR